ncbi:MAG: YhfC family intramembrane metalloprotease [Clostridiales bacterium]|nr:YhfC family intramembrane metalloprotease [Clostridiales bacterium]
MDTYPHVGTASIVWMVVGLILFVTVPVAVAIVWKIKKKEPFTTILIGAAAFLLFAIILEKSIQNVLIFPTEMGLSGNPLSIALASHPVLLALATGLFPGIFEETGRLVAFKTLLRKRTNRETSISYGIGHGGIEVVFVLGLMYFQFLSYAMMLNNGTFGTVVAQVAEKAPEKLSQVQSVIDSLTGFTFTTLLAATVERVFAVLFHIGASILVFYACKDKKKFWLYPLAILLHTAMDFIAALALFNVVDLSGPALTGSVAVFSTVVFAGAYFLLYRKDTAINN